MAQIAIAMISNISAIAASTARRTWENSIDF